MTDKLEWKDATSYSKGEDRTPTAWRLTVGEGWKKVSVYVTRAHRWYPDRWVMVCEVAGIPGEHPKDLGAVQLLSEDQAKTRAVLIAVIRIKKIAATAAKMLDVEAAE